MFTTLYARLALMLVSDTGQGIASTELPRIFERFYRGPDAGPQRGGLGLAIARRVQRLGAAGNGGTSLYHRNR